MARIEFDGKQIDVPEFALEKTMQEVLKVLRETGVRIERTGRVEKDLNNITKKASEQNKKADADMQKLGEQANKIQANILKEETKQSTTASKMVEQSKKNSKAQQGFLEKALNATAGSGGVFGGVLGGLTKFGKFLNPVTAGLAGLAKGIMAAIKFFLRLGQLENTLFRRGFVIEPDQGVAGGIASFGAQAADAGLRLEQAAELAQEFATTFGEFGTKTVFQAIRSTQELIREQGYLGLSTAEIASAVAESADIFRQLGLDLEGNPKLIAQMSTNLLQSAQAFSRLTNTSADLIRQTVIQASSMEAFTNALNMLPAQLRSLTLQSAQTAFSGLAGFGPLGGELAQALSDGIGRGGLQFTQFGQDLARVAPNLLGGLQNIANTVNNNGDVGSALEQFRKGILDVNTNNRQFLRALEISGDPMAKTIINLANLAETIDDADMRLMASFRESIEAPALGKAQAQLRIVIERLRAAFDKLLIAFMQPEVVDGFLKTVEFFEDKLMSLANWLSTDGFRLLRDGFNKLINFFSDAGGGMKNMFQWLTGSISTSVSAGINRALAKSIYGGDTGDELKKMDSLVEKYRKSQNEDDLKKLFDYVFNTTTIFGMEQGVGTLFEKDYKNKENALKMLEDRIGKYGVTQEFMTTKMPEIKDPEKGDTSTQSSLGGMATTRRSNIRIMPMFGDPGSQMQETPEEKAIRLQMENNELQRELVEINKKLLASSNKTAFSTEKTYQETVGKAY
jgi:hypothetical protein